LLDAALESVSIWKPPKGKAVLPVNFQVKGQRNSFEKGVFLSFFHARIFGSRSGQKEKFDDIKGEV
jgi:hypothetical protein